MSRPRLLDLYCGAGGAAMGYHRAGFDVVGVDNVHQKNYPFAFVQADALAYVAAHGQKYDAIHASPPCQGYSRMRHLPWLKDREYPLLIDATRAALDATGRPWVIENVEGAPLPAAAMLCGTMFGLKVYRHRWFEGSILLLSPGHPKHREVIGKGRLFNDRQRGNAAGFVSLVGKDARGGAAMGIDWMTRDELAQAIPPAYTAWIGRQLLAALAGAGAEAAD